MYRQVDDLPWPPPSPPTYSCIHPPARDAYTHPRAQDAGHPAGHSIAMWQRHGSVYDKDGAAAQSRRWGQQVLGTYICVICVLICSRACSYMHGA